MLSFHIFSIYSLMFIVILINNNDLGNFLEFSGGKNEVGVEPKDQICLEINDTILFQSIESD